MHVFFLSLLNLQFSKPTVYMLPLVIIVVIIMIIIMITIILPSQGSEAKKGDPNPKRVIP